MWNDSLGEFDSYFLCMGSTGIEAKMNDILLLDAGFGGLVVQIDMIPIAIVKSRFRENVLLMIENKLPRICSIEHPGVNKA